MKVVFMGTPDFAVPALSVLFEHHEVTAVITQPDKPVGRGKKLTFSPVKEFALENGIKVYQPEKIKKEEFVHCLKTIEADVFIVTAYGQILSKTILDMPQYGCLNIHASLLPKYRGAAPIQWAVIHDEKETGVTIMQMDTGIDTGDMLLQEKTLVAADETGGSLHGKLSILGAEAIIKALEDMESGNVERIKQDSTQSTYAPMLRKTTGLIDWTKSSREIECLIRGLNPWPSAYSRLENHGIIKIWEAEIIEFESKANPGTIVIADKNSGMVVRTGDGHLLIRQIQAEGGKRMPTSTYLLGHAAAEGERFDMCTAPL